MTLDDIVSYPKVKNVKILLERSARNSAIANKMHSGQIVTEETEGKSWLFYIPEVPKEVIIPWILSQGGEAIPLEPQEIVDEVKLRTAAILERLA
ncbi:MAG: WYL domain-containing protein [Lentisphaeria bacterium]|nr:WYL domain-containing protein [Lentisphaeria bacterium]